MKVKLLHHTPLWIADKAIGKCWDKPTPEGQCNTERIDRVANKNKHGSTIEHISYNFDIDGISRACLQELARHRITSLSVKSSRYTMSKDLKNESDFKDLQDKERASKYIVLTGDDFTDYQSIIMLDMLRQNISKGTSNDISKYNLIEAYKTSLVWSINARSLQNFLSLRINHRQALWEIVTLAENIALSLPNDHKFLYKNIIDEFASPEFKEVFTKSMV